MSFYVPEIISTNSKKDFSVSNCSKVNNILGFLSPCVCVFFSIICRPILFLYFFFESKIFINFVYEPNLT